MRNAVERRMNNVERHTMLGAAARLYAVTAMINKTRILDWIRMYLGP
jgi:hypothetical protein